ncbi:VWA domain-containing protein [Patescibacteria group bacterium]
MGLDLIFVVDTTGSMYDDIAAAKASAVDIVNTLESSGLIDYRAAVVDYRDFPIDPYGASGDYPYHAVLPFSSDSATIIGAINSLSLGNGLDWPESLYSALIRAMLCEGLGDWRNVPGIKKSVIVMTDAPPHDPEPFTGYTSADVILTAFLVDPAIVFPICIGYDSTTYSYLQVLAEGGGFSYV